MDVWKIGARLHSAASLRSQGIGRSSREELVRAKKLIVVRRGWYTESSAWSEWHTEERHTAAAIAAVRSMRGGDVVLSHTSAAVVWGLPLFRYSPRRVHVTGPGGNGNTRQGDAVARHVALIDGDRAEVDGLAVTSLARTVADTVGRIPLAAAVALADAALHAVAWNPQTRRRYHPEVAEGLRHHILGAATLQAGARGSVQGRWVVDFADGRAQSPIESLSRLYLHQLGFAPPRLQVRLAHASGYYEIDIGLDDVDAWLEIDGSGKYTDPKMLGERTTAEAVIAEKWREDDIRGRTGRRVVRAGTAHLGTLESLSTRLAGFGIRAPGAPGALPPGFAGRGL
ncbi:hypothetical protein ACTU3I_13685 [Microbacterium sp. RD1]|uniref:hypothetical protein n=1 Tax=Microbacterium sp. RD1 TaxID=3457313 RepID=UPI003FA5B7E6